MPETYDFQPPVLVSQKLGSRKKNFMTFKGLLYTTIAITIAQLTLGVIVKNKKIENLENYASSLESKNANLSSRIKVFEQWADIDSRLQLSRSKAQMYEDRTQRLLEQNERLSRQLQDSSTTNLELAKEIERLYELMDGAKSSQPQGAKAEVASQI